MLLFTTEDYLICNFSLDPAPFSSSITLSLNVYLCLMHFFHFFFFLSCSSSFFVGWRWNPGDQWWEYQGHEACASYWAHQEWRATRPSGAQEGWRISARIWWVNLRKHSLLPNLHALIWDRLVDGGGGKNYIALLGPSTLPWDKSSRDGEFDGHGCLSGGGHCWAMGFWGGGGSRSGCAPVGPVALPLKPALSFHVIPLSLFTFWALSRNSVLGLFRKVMFCFSPLNTKTGLSGHSH